MEIVTQPVSPDDIDLSFVARLVPDLEVMTVGDEQIVVSDDAGVMALNRPRALIFGFLDGEATLAELTDDFTEVLGVDRDVVERDVLQFARHLGANGLLEGVAWPPPEMPEGWDEGEPWEPPAPLEVGDEIDDFTLTDLDGEQRSLSDFRGRRTLLVNWSPGCGFCVTIASELAALDPVLTEQDVSLVFVTLGDAESNRALNEQHGLGAPMLLRDGTETDPFNGTGTPAALLLDAEGTLAEAMSVGANQVPVPGAGSGRTRPRHSLRCRGGRRVGTRRRARRRRGARDLSPGAGAMCGPGGGGGASEQHAVGGHARLRARRVPRRRAA